MGQPQPTGTLLPQTPTPSQKSQPMLRTKRPSSDREMPKAMYQPRGGVHSNGRTTASVTSCKLGSPPDQSRPTIHGIDLDRCRFHQGSSRFLIRSDLPVLGNVGIGRDRGGAPKGLKVSDDHQNLEIVESDPWISHGRHFLLEAREDERVRLVKGLG